MTAHSLKSTNSEKFKYNNTDQTKPLRLFIDVWIRFELTHLSLLKHFRTFLSVEPNYRQYNLNIQQNIEQNIMKHYRSSLIFLRYIKDLHIVYETYFV